MVVGGALFESTDGGATWVQRDVPASLGDGLNGMFLADVLHGWVWGNVNYRTTDGGTTWTELPLLGSTYFMEFATPSFGVATGNFGAAVSSDGGLTWASSPNQMTAFDFADDLVGLGASSTGLYRTTDCGATFGQVLAGDATAVAFLSGTAAVAIVASPGGDAWMAGSRGAIRHFAGPPPPPVNRPPTSSFEFLATGLSVAFADTSSDPDGIITGWLWDFGDGTSTTEPTPTHLFPGADTYIVRLTVTDDDGATGASVRFIVVQPGPGGTFGDFTEVTPLDPLFVTPQDEDFWVATTAPADFDNDGDLDLLLVNLSPLTDDGFIRRYRNDGGGVFVGEDILGNLRVEHGEAQWGDHDADGDLDILVAGHIRETDGSFDTVLRIYRNDAESWVPFEVMPCPSCEGWFDLTAATWADYDSDGDVDILLAGNYNPGSQIEGRAKVYINEAGVFSDSGSQLPAPRAMGSRGGSFTWLDLDGEGDLDRFIAGACFVPGGNGLVEAQMHLYRNDSQGVNASPSAPSFLVAGPGGSPGSVVLGWNPATDDLTPSHALTYDLRVYRDGAPAATPHGLPEPGGLSAIGQWTLTGLTDGGYTWTLRAVDSAYNAGQVSEGTFTVTGAGSPPLFVDGCESGSLSGWSVVVR